MYVGKCKIFSKWKINVETRCGQHFPSNVTLDGFYGGNALWRPTPHLTVIIPQSDAL